jgi:hypothetical protein
MADAANDLPGIVEFGERRAHDVTRRAELLGQFALGGDPFARLYAPLIDVALDRRLHLGDLLTRANADVLA